MRYFFFFISLFFFGCNQENFVTISGKFKNMDGVSVMLTFEDKVLKTDTIRKGSLNLVVRLPVNRLFRISFKDSIPDRYLNNGMPIYNAPSIELFSGDKKEEHLITASAIKDLSDIDKCHVPSSQNQIEYQSYKSLLKKDRTINKAKFAVLIKKQDEALSAKNDSLYTLYSDSLRFQEQLNKITHNSVTKKFIADNPNSYVSMYLLSKRSDLKSNLAFYQLLYSKADRKYRKSWYGLLFAKRVEQLEKLRKKYIKRLGINALDVRGLRFNYGKYADSKLIVLDLWATWCIPCMEEMPAALTLAQELEKKSVSYIFLSYDFNNEYWRQQSNKIGLKNSYYLSEPTRKFLGEELQIVSLPRYMIMNNKGEILVMDAPSPSSPELKKLIESML